MRVVTLVLALLALPTLLAAQQPGELVDDPTTPTVQVEQATPTVSDQVSADAPDIDETTIDYQTTDADDAAMQEGPRSMQWWWLVGAIVVGGIILAVLL